MTAPPAHDGDHLLREALLLMVATALAVVGVGLVTGDSLAAAVAGGLAAWCLLLLAALRLRVPARVVALASVAGLLAATTAAVGAGEGLRDPALMLYPAAVLLGAMVVPRRSRVVLAAIAGLAVLGVGLADHFGLLPTGLSPVPLSDVVVAGLIVASTAVVGERMVRSFGRAVASARDSEAARAESEELFRTAFRTSPDALSITRLSDGVYLEANEGFTRITGWSAADLVGRSSVDLGIWTDPADRDRLVYELQARGRMENLEAQFRRKDGTPLIGLMSAQVITVSNQRCLLAVTRDITSWRQAQADRERLEEQLRQSQKLEALGQLAGGVAHDFNNLLTSILTCGRFLQEELGPGHPARPDADQVVQSGERAAVLTRQLLTLARRQRVAPRPMQLAAAVRGMEGMLRRTLGESIALEVEADAPGTVVADPAQLELAVLNLAVNGRDAMPDGGRLVLRVEELEPGHPALAGEAGLPEPPLVRLTVSDSGVGMSDETQARIFEPFFTTKPAGTGTGLGLSTVYGVVTQCGGAIRVRSAPGAGTEVRLYFPRSGAPAADAAHAPTELARGAGTIAVVEDDPQVRTLVLRTLRSAGYAVVEAESPSAAIAALRAHPRPVDLLLTDVLLPERNGWELSREVLAVRPGLRVLFMSGFAGDRLDGRPILPADAPVVLKPFTPQELLGRVRAALLS